MCNDPKDAVVDISKFMQSQQTTTSTTQIPHISMGTDEMITSCNESADLLIGHEQFSLNENAGNKNSD